MNKLLLRLPKENEVDLLICAHQVYLMTRSPGRSARVGEESEYLRVLCDEVLRFDIPEELEGCFNDLEKGGSLEESKRYCELAMVCEERGWLPYAAVAIAKALAEITTNEDTVKKNPRAYFTHLGVQAGIARKVSEHYGHYALLNEREDGLEAAISVWHNEIVIVSAEKILEQMYVQGVVQLLDCAMRTKNKEGYAEIRSESQTDLRLTRYRMELDISNAEPTAEFN